MSFPSFITGQIFSTPPLPTQSFEGQIIIVTGANTGLGLDCAKHLVRLNVSRLILACRSVEKGENAKSRILSANTTAATVIEVWPLDLGRYESVLSFAQRCESLDRLDAVVQNAGVDIEQFTISEKDETTLTVNVVSAALLAVLLLPKLRESARKYNILPRISVVNSFVHAIAKTKELVAMPVGEIFKTLSTESKADMADRYHLSKLLILLFNRELSSRLEKADQARVVINNPSPGWAKTELFRDVYETWPAPRKWAFKHIARTSEVASRCLVNAVAAGNECQGEWLEDCRVKPASGFVRSEQGREVQLKIWDEVVGKLSEISTRAREVLEEL